MEYGSNHNIGRTTLYLCSRPRSWRSALALHRP